MSQQNNSSIQINLGLCWTCDEKVGTHKEFRDALGENEITCDACHREEYPEKYEDEKEICPCCGDEWTKATRCDCPEIQGGNLENCDFCGKEEDSDEIIRGTEGDACGECRHLCDKKECVCFEEEDISEMTDKEYIFYLERKVEKLEFEVIHGEEEEVCSCPAKGFRFEEEKRKYSVNPLCSSCWGDGGGGCDCAYKMAEPMLDIHKINCWGNVVRKD